MNTSVQTTRFSQRVIRQVRMDASRAMNRANFCPDRSEVLQLRCMDDREETTGDFGRQLWFFEGIGYDELDNRMPVFGTIEYSLQYGLLELVDDGVFDSETQRRRVQQLYTRTSVGPRWQHPAHRFLIVGMAAVALAYLAYLTVRIAPW